MYCMGYERPIASLEPFSLLSQVCEEASKSQTKPRSDVIAGMNANPVIKGKRIEVLMYHGQVISAGR